jgi:hypothetical protein
MSGQPGIAVNKDLEQLRLLATFHYIVGAITAILLSFPLIHVVIGLLLMLNPGGLGVQGKQAAPVRLFGVFFFAIGGAVVLFGWTLGALTAYAGRCISRHEKHTFCVVVACVNCMHMPIGTLLGVFTLIVLFRDSVRQLFAARRPAAAHQGPSFS